MKTKAPPTPALAPRRRPRQSRAKHTARALQEAFVQLLVECDYASITIREIVLVAGTSLGSFYEYFASKEDLARVCLHLRSKRLLVALREAVAAHRGQPLAQVVDAVIASQLAVHGEQTAQWRVHYLLERHLSSLEAYRKMYERFVNEWVTALDAMSDLPVGRSGREAARVCQTLMYGLFAHAYLSGVPTGGPDPAALRRTACLAITAYLGAAG